MSVHSGRSCPFDPCPDDVVSDAMPPNPETGLLNVTFGEVSDAIAATEDVPLVRPDWTLTPAGVQYVADLRRAGGAS